MTCLFDGTNTPNQLEMEDIQERDNDHQNESQHHQHPVHDLLRGRQVRNQLPVQKRRQCEASKRHRESAHEANNALERREASREDHHDHQHADPHQPLLPRLHEQLILVGVCISPPFSLPTIVQQRLQAENGRVRDDGVREQRVQREQTGRDEVEPALVVDVLDEDLADAAGRAVVQQRAAHAHEDVEEAGEKEGAVEDAAEFRLVVHRPLRGGAVEGHREAQTAHTEHVGEVTEALGPEEGGLEVDLEMETSVNDVEDDGGEEGDESSNRHKGHGTKITQQRERNHDDKIHRSPEELATSERETPILPRKSR